MAEDAPLRGHVVVFGFRGVARRIVKQLAKTGRTVVVVDPDATPSERETLRRYAAIHVPGFGQSEEALRRSYVSDALAAICATDDDLRNIEIALLVRERSKDVRIVVQMASSAVGEALKGVAEPGAVLELAKLASGAFVEAALARTTHPVMLGDEEFLAFTVRAPRQGALRSLWGETAPIAIRPADGSPTRSCPSRDDEAQEGDLVTLLATRGDFLALGLQPEADPSRSRPTFQRRFRELSNAVSDAVDVPFRVAFGLLAVLGLISVILLRFAYVGTDGRRMSWLDAMYFTAETIATVGFGDFYFRDQPGWLRLWAILIILFGAALVAVATALLTNALVSRRLEASLGVQRVTGMHDHIVVIGLGAIGSQVATDLREAGHEVAVIDVGTGQRFIPQMRERGIPVLIGDATLKATQLAAGVDRAAGVAVLTNDDLVNIETGLAVRAVGGTDIPIALRVFGRNLARLVRDGLDAGVARSVAELSAPWFVGAAVGLEVVGTFYVGDIPFLATRITVRPGDPFDGFAIADLGQQTRVVAIQRSGTSTLEHPLQRELVFRAGDVAYVVGQFEDLLDLFERS